MVSLTLGGAMDRVHEVLIIGSGCGGSIWVAERFFEARS